MVIEFACTFLKDPFYSFIFCITEWNANSASSVSKLGAFKNDKRKKSVCINLSEVLCMDLVRTVDR